ncbi:MAG: DUF4118 domain-containing protein [Hyphomicrobiaceae bacterium]
MSWLWMLGVVVKSGAAHYAPDQAFPFGPKPVAAMAERLRETQGRQKPKWLKHLLVALLGAGMTLFFSPMVIFFGTTLHLRDHHILYMIPVIIAATRWGLTCALASALTSSAIEAYYFYAPFYSLAVFSSSDIVSLMTFVVVAIVTSQLSTMVREHAAAADRNYHALQQLYGLSRDLAAASTPEEMRAAIQAHVSALVGGRVWLVQQNADGLISRDDLPQSVRDGFAKGIKAGSAVISNAEGHSHWLVRALPSRLKPQEFLIAEIGAVAPQNVEPVTQRIDALLDQCIGTIERLDLSTTVAEAEVRRQSLSLKEAVIGSASHSLRTPLASILGAASILAEAGPVKAEPQLSQLAALVVGEAERLNGDIQKMLDAATLSSAGLKPYLVWSEVSDIINAAVEAKLRELEGHNVVIDCERGLPFVHSDLAMAREALGLILDNAARYSQRGSSIRIVARRAGPLVNIHVDDEGVGFNAAESSRLTEKFYRGERVRDLTRGSGLGLWIANSFMTACHGGLAIAARPEGGGSRVTLSFTADVETETELPGSNDD